ncbi:MAG: hypothetical protein B6245_03460 [Desulfobacteraceae bacterium 4572_88]|nr:MAG: hypothetical protein B6245_03460 [Desulfobacteraceae bacterium 4572_88]
MKFEIYNLRRDLDLAGWPTIKAWAEFRNYKADTVRRVISRHWGQKTVARGKITLKILRDIKKSLGELYKNDLLLLK